MPEMIVRALAPADRERVREFITQHWAAATVVAHGVVYHPHELPGFVASRGDEIAGLVTLHIVGNACEIVTIDSTQPGAGIGTTLIDAAKTFARQTNCSRLWLITPRHNPPSLRWHCLHWEVSQYRR